MSIKGRVLILLLLVWALAPGCAREKSHSIQLSNEGMRAYGKGDLKASSSHFKQALSYDSENHHAHYGLGLVHIDRGNLEQSRRHLLKVRGLKPDHIEASYQIGWIAMKEGRSDEAMSSFQQVLALSPDHPESNLQMGHLEESREKLDTANTYFRRAVQLLPYRPDIYHALALLYAKVGARDEAVAVLREGVRLCTPARVRKRRNLSLMYNEMGGLLLEAGQYAEAVDILLQAVRLDAPIDVAFNLACAYAANGDIENAITYFNQFLAGDSQDEHRIVVARKVMSHLQTRLQKRESDAMSETEGS